MKRQTQFIRPETEAKIDALLEAMTIEEKIGQLHQVGPSPVGGFDVSLEEKKKMLADGRLSPEEYEKALSGAVWDTQEDDVRAGRIGSFLGWLGAEKSNHLQKVAVEESRLGIPLLMGMDVIHGQHTIFPTPLAESCSWDESLFERTAAIAAKEAAADGVHWTFAPMIDVARDARWGRIAEGAGEDAYLTSRFAVAKVRGFQGQQVSDPDRILACAKHFVAYGAAIGGRDYNSADISLQTLWETYLPPFRAAAEAGVATFMGAFNDLNGVPCTANAYLLRNILRDTFGFNGFVVSDANAVDECVNHGLAAGRRDAAALSLNAGTEMDMCSGCYAEHLAGLVREGIVSMERLNQAVRHILRIKFAKGLFEHPYTDTEASRISLCAAHRQAARDAGRRSLVLLKNQGVLPLTPSLKLAVVGELADKPEEMLGTWAFEGRGEDTVSLLAGLTSRCPHLRYAPCCGVDSPLDRPLLEETIRDADVVIAAVGEWADLSGEASSLSHLGLRGEQNELIAALKASKKPFVTVLFNGRPLAIPEAVEQSPALVEAWHLGTEAGNAIADVLFGDYNPSGRLTTTFPNRSGECPRYYNHLNTGRPCGESRFASKYLDAPLTPLFPFGYGLSYTTYDYRDLYLRRKDDTLFVHVTVANTGSVDGEETVQVYLQDLVASRARPVRELKVFRKVFLKAGEEVALTISVDCHTLGFYNEKLEYIVEPGEFRVFVGHDSTASLSASFILA